jgi:type III secretory pathway component EscV
MAPTASDLHSDRPFSHLHPAPAAAVITDARDASSKELSSRMRRYTIAMTFRLACFLGMAFVDGWLRWTLLAFAVFLPYIAVVLANQSDQRTVTSHVEHGAPQDAPALTTGAEGVVLTGEVVSGEVVDDGLADEYARPAA